MECNCRNCKHNNPRTILDPKSPCNLGRYDERVPRKCWEPKTEENKENKPIPKFSRK